MTVSVLVADTSAVLRAALCRQLAAYAELAVVGEAADAVHAVELARRLNPDVVLLEVGMRGVDGESPARRIVPAGRVLMTGLTGGQQPARAAFAAGASGYLVHGSFDAATLIASVRAVAAGAAAFTTEASRTA